MHVEWREDRASEWQNFTSLRTDVTGQDIAAEIIRERMAYDPANWERFDGQIEIRSPVEIEGVYEISIDWSPTISAEKL